MKTRFMAGAAPASFAHLMGAPVASARAEGDDKDKDKEAKARKARRAAEDKKRLEEDDRRKKEDARRAEEDGTDMDDDLDNRDDPDHEEAPAPIDTDDILDERDHNKDDDDHDPDEVTDDMGDDDDDMDDDAKRARRKGQKAERSRWTKVLGHKEAAGRVGPACAMLANGNMTPGAIVATLKSMPAQAAGPRSSLRDRMAAERIPNPGPNAQESRARTETEQFVEQAAAVRRRLEGKAR